MDIKQLNEHLRLLAKHGADSEEEIREGLFANPCKSWNNNLLSWNFGEQPRGKVMTVLFASGNGNELINEIKKISKENNCVKIYCVSQRPKGMERKFGFKPVGTLMEMGG